MKHVWYYEYQIGNVGICEEEGGISKIFFQKESCLEGYILSQTPLIEKAATQLSEYFAGTRKSFDLQLAPNGTDFQQKVWAALQTIPFGQTCSYKDIALQIGKPKAYRAVGMANNKNPIVIVIPCHRVIGSDGTLIGYGGGLPVKEYLLKLEGKS